MDIGNSVVIAGGEGGIKGLKSIGKNTVKIKNKTLFLKWILYTFFSQNFKEEKCYWNFYLLYDFKK